MYPGDGSSSTTLEIKLEGSLTSKNASVCIWTKLFTNTFGDGGGSPFVELELKHSGSIKHSASKRRNSNAGVAVPQGCSTSLSSAGLKAWPNTGVPTLWGLTIENTSGNLYTANSYHNGELWQTFSGSKSTYPSSGTASAVLDFITLRGMESIMVEHL